MAEEGAFQGVAVSAYMANETVVWWCTEWSGVDGEWSGVCTQDQERAFPRVPWIGGVMVFRPPELGKEQGQNNA